MDQRKVVIKKLDNLIGRFLIRYYAIALFPVAFMGIFVFGYLVEHTVGTAKGIIVRSFDKELAKDSYSKTYGVQTRLHDVLYIVLEDSTRFFINNKSDVTYFKKIKYLNRYAEIKYRSGSQGAFGGMNSLFESDRGRYRNAYVKNTSEYLAINSIKFKNGEKIKFRKANVYFVVTFIFFLIWFLLGLFNYATMIWNAAPYKPKVKKAIGKIEYKHGKYISKFTKCPACGMKLNIDDLECPDCGLCFQ